MAHVRFVTLRFSGCLQVTFKGGVQQMHGFDNSAPLRPDFRVTITNSTAERVISVFGNASGNTITSIGFRTTTGRTYGPQGLGGGDSFQVDGLVLGFFGALDSGAISGLGVWYTPVDTSTPGDTMFKPALDMSPAYGNLVNVWTWDDTPDMGGAHPVSLPPVVGRGDCCGAKSGNEGVHHKSVGDMQEDGLGSACALSAGPLRRGTL
jgi:hypothetical protein